MLKIKLALSNWLQEKSATEEESFRAHAEHLGLCKQEIDQLEALAGALAYQSIHNKWEMGEWLLRKIASGVELQKIIDTWTETGTCDD